MKFFTMNVNLSLSIPLLILLIYGTNLIRKFRKRNQYIQNREQLDKDLYTVMRRSTQWIYDHFVFPAVNVFSIITFCCTILYLGSISKNTKIRA
jgi:hypothetical protein